MKMNPGNARFWLQWAAIALAVFASSFLLSSRDRHFSEQWAKPDLPEYKPFHLNHFTLAVDPADYKFLFSDPPESLSVFRDAEVLVNLAPVVLKASMRIRGTHSWNWDPHKPSFRLRQRGKNKILARSNLNFAVADDPSMLSNLIADHIAVDLHIPSPRTTLCTVSINDDFKGLYHLSDPMNPEAMGWQGFVGASVVEGDVRSSKMWREPELWEIQAAEEGNLAPSFNCLANMLKIVAPPVQLGSIETLSEVLNLERMASWSALLTAIGSIRANDFFGQVFLYTNDEKKLFPAIADPMGFGVLTSIAGVSNDADIKMPPYEVLTPLMNAFFRIPECQFQRNRALYQLLRNQLSETAIKALVDRFMSILRPQFHKEPYASALMTVPILKFPKKIPVSTRTQIEDADRLLRFMAARRAFLLDIMKQSEVAVVTSSTTSDIAGIPYRHLVLQISGHSPIEWDFSTWKGKVLTDANFDGILEHNLPEFYAIQRFYPGLKEDTSPQPEFLQLDRRVVRCTLVPDSQTYVLGVCEDHVARFLEFLRTEGRNALTGEAITGVSCTAALPDAIPPRPNPAVLHPWRKMPHG